MKELFVNQQFKRTSYTSLNGKWNFKITSPINLEKNIEVPYAPETEISGIGYKNFIFECEYNRQFEINKEDLDDLIILHFDAVDYESIVFVNGELIGTHIGGYTAFSFDITKYVKEGINELVVKVKDDCRKDSASGKQCYREKSFGCFYTRTTGIWRDVYLEKVPLHYIRHLRINPDVDNGSVSFEIKTSGIDDLEIKVTYKNSLMGFISINEYKKEIITIPLKEKHLWEVGKGRLYDVEITYGKDKVNSYFGLRKVYFKEKKFFVNDKEVFQMLVLDQGFYKIGNYTAQNVEEAIRDIDLAIALGFNGARLHQRVFDQVYLEYADRKGFIVWQEYGSWGLRNGYLDSLPQFKKEWEETMRMMYNHPSIVVWCPLNEAWKDFTEEAKLRDIRYCEEVYDLTHKIDPSRPCVDTSGGYHSKHNDIADFHNYFDSKQIKQTLADLEISYEKALSPLETVNPYIDGFYDEDKPTILSEYGGMSYACFTGHHDEEPWGYVNYKNSDEFVNEYIALTNLVKNCKVLSGCCYTQLYDVEQEQNGLYTYDRKPKLNEEQIDKIRKCNEK